MPLQSDNLVMIGLGILNDVPPIDRQPPLKDGIHGRTLERDGQFVTAYGAATAGRIK